MRRISRLAQPKCTSLALVSAPKPLATQRNFLTGFDLFCSLAYMSLCIAAFASWGNNIANLMKFGRYRFRYMMDEVILPLDFKVARYLGGLFGLWYYFTWVGPAKYEHSDLEKWSTRIGPF